MLWAYLGEVGRRAFSPTARMTDALQVVAASALPAVGKVFGLNIPATAEADILAYIGLAAVAYIAIRFIWAPYAIWKDDRVEVAQLKIELSKPERLIIENMAKIQAKKRVKLSRQIQKMHMVAFYRDGHGRAIDQLNKEFIASIHLAQNCGLETEFSDHLEKLYELVKARISSDVTDGGDFEATNIMQQYVSGLISLAELAGRMPEVRLGEPNE